MKLQHKCVIRAPLATVWDLTSRIDEIAPCLPGGSAIKTDDENFDTAMKLRLGPLDLLFRGKMMITERDAGRSRMVLTAKANESRGQGSASAVTVIQLSSVDSATHALIDTDLLISGRVAQMGRGIVAEVSDDLLAKFVANLEKYLEGKGATRADISREAGDRGTTANVQQIRNDGTEEKLPEHLNIFALLARILWRRVSGLFRSAERNG